MSAALNRLTKWRTVFAGWQLGTRAKGDPECDAVRDHREVTMLMRCELNALAGLLIEKGVLTAEEYQRRLDSEADYLSAQYARKFPGFKATDHGIDVNTAIAADTTRGWRP
ncbi:MAG: hypothetical protein J0M00_17615 [Burkholderiales bacterium]|nr:hypothetical protein [Burkholderiales bacterium]